MDPAERRSDAGFGPDGVRQLGAWRGRCTCVRNDNYHGSVSPDVVNKGIARVDGVDIQFVADTDAQVNALKSARRTSS